MSGGDAGEGERVVDLEFGLVLGQAHLLDAVGQGLVLGGDPLQGIFLGVLVFEVEPREFASGVGEGPKIGRVGYPRQVALEAIRVFLAVPGMVQQPVHVVEDVPLGDGIVPVLLAEGLQRPVRNVFPPIRAVFVVNIEGEALGVTSTMEINNGIAN